MFSLVRVGARAWRAMVHALQPYFAKRQRQARFFIVVLHYLLPSRLTGMSAARLVPHDRQAKRGSGFYIGASTETS